MRKHVESCWGEDALKAAMEAGSEKDARETVVKELRGSGTITASFERKGKGKVTFSHRQHTKAETKSVMLPCQILQLYLTIDLWLYIGQKLSAGFLKTYTHSKLSVTMVFRV